MGASPPTTRRGRRRGPPVATGAVERRPGAGRRASTRTRLEQRFVETGSDAGWRLRQFVKYSRPSAAAATRPWSRPARSSWRSTTPTGAPDPASIRSATSRASPSRSPPKARLELGYLNQYIDRPGSEDRVNHAAAVNLLARSRCLTSAGA